MDKDRDEGGRVDLIALAERVEAATGPDRELDRDVADACGFGPPADWTRHPRKHDGCINIDCGSWTSPGGGRIRDSRRYTASLDAAMTLVPEGWGWLVSQPNAKAIASGLLKERTPVLGEVQNGSEARYAVACATPALALTAAALRARATQGGSHD